MRVLLLLLGAAVLLASHVSEAKIGGKKVSSREDTWLLEKELEADLKDFEELENEEEDGSGDYDDDDEDYDDEDYDEDDDLEGSGGDFSTSSFEDTFIDDLDTKRNNNVVKKTNNKEAVETSSSSSDIHFAEDDDDLLSEYYEEEYEPDYYDDEDVYIKKNTKEIEEENVVVVVTPKEEAAPGGSHGVLDAFLRSLRPSYVYITLASALLSFVLALAAFFLCRRSSLARRQEKKLVPFVVGDARLQFNPAAGNGGSIVKSYQRVPTSTREFLSGGSQVHGSRVVEMGAAEKKGLLA